MVKVIIWAGRNPSQKELIATPLLLICALLHTGGALVVVAGTSVITTAVSIVVSGGVTMHKHPATPPKALGSAFEQSLPTKDVVVWRTCVTDGSPVSWGTEKIAC